MDPFKNMGEWKKNLDNFFGDGFWSEFDGILKPPIPQINIYQKDNELLCLANIPGLTSLKNIDVFVDYTTLEIKGIIDLGHASGQVFKEEILQGAFERKIDLPFPVRSDKIEATYQRGLLVIRLHRHVSVKNQKNRLEIKDLEENG